MSDTLIFKTFIFNKKYYFYEPYYNNLFEINRGLFLELIELTKVGLCNYKNNTKKTSYYTDVISLIDKGLITNTFIATIRHPETKNAKYLIKRCINEITLQVTRDCNFNCRYCLFANGNNMQRNHEKKNMSFETAKRSVDFLYNNSQDSHTIGISFYGGEPLINFKLIKEVVQYANNKFYSKKINYSMTINGSLLSNDIINFLINHNFKISISLDGPEHIQNLHRKFRFNGAETFKTVFKNINSIKKINEKFFYKNISFMPVVIKGENYQLIKDFFYENGIYDYQVIPLRADLTGIDYILSDKLISSNLEKQNFNNFDEIEQSHLNKMINILRNRDIIPNKWHHNGQCLPGVRRLFIDVFGNFYPCEKVPEKTDLSIGNLNNGINLIKVKKIMNIGKLTENECKSCWAIRFCNMCVSSCYDADLQQITRKQKLFYCNIQKEETLDFFKNFILLQSKNKI